MENIILSFFSTHQALKAEKILKKRSLKIDLIPTPREISSECGFALLVTAVDKSEIAVLKAETKLNFDQIYVIREDKGVKKYEKYC